MTEPIFHVVSTTIVHTFAAYHQNFKKDIELPFTKFVNEQTYALMDFFKKK
jgi:hypothetical protein